MKVLILTKTFPERENDWGGIFVKEQVEALTREHKVTVVKFKTDNTRFNPFFNYSIEEQANTGYRYLIVSVSRSFPVYNQFHYIISVYLALQKILKNNNPDLVHCHYSYPAGVIARLINLKMRIPYLITEHTQIRKTFRSVFHKKLSLWALRHSCNNIAVSEALKNELICEGINKVEVVPNVVDFGKFSISFKKHSGLKIGFLGSLNSHNKGLDLLLKACTGLNLNYIVKIGGGGLHYKFYEDMARELGISGKCLFKGEVAKTDISVFYSDLDLFVLPSRYETFGIVLVEAMASGLPVISTRCGGPEEIVNDISGILVDPDNIDQLRKAIENIGSNPEKYNPEEIRNYALNKWGIIPFLNKINPIYQRCFSRQEV
jgi:L-malate glycosyltransferase